MRVAVCVGHRRRSPGASSVDGVTEWAWLQDLASLLAMALRARGVDADVWTRDQHGGLRGMVAALNRQPLDAVIDLHFNAHSDPDANGSEVLHYPGSARGAALASACLAGLLSALGLRDRGLKPTMTNGRGERLPMLCDTAAPTCIVEVGFGSNAGDWAAMNAANARPAIADAVADKVSRMTLAP